MGLRHTRDETGPHPPRPDWRERYAAATGTDALIAGRWPTLDDALASAKPMVDPVLKGEAVGTWEPGIAHCVP